MALKATIIIAAAKGIARWWSKRRERKHKYTELAQQELREWHQKMERKHGRIIDEWDE